MFEVGYFLPSQKSGLTTTLWNKFLKIKQEEDLNYHSSALKENKDDHTYTFD